MTRASAITQPMLSMSITTSITLAQYRKFETMAARQGISKSELMRKLVEEYLAGLDTR